VRVPVRIEASVLRANACDFQASHGFNRYVTGIGVLVFFCAIISLRADAVLSLYGGKLPYRVRTNSTNGQRMVNDAATLDSFNRGMLTPGCGG
jgi:hypothetical protein